MATSTVWLALGIGLASGLMGGFFGVGGGIVMVPAMVFLMQRDIKVAVGTSLAVIVPIALVGAVRHVQNGFVDWKVVLAMAPAAIAASYAGAWLTRQVDGQLIKQVFGVLLLLVGGKLLIGR